MAGRDRRRRRTALVVSLLIHTVLLAPLLLVAPKFRPVKSPTRANMVLGLVPAAKLGIATHQTQPGSAATSQLTLGQASRQLPAPSSTATAQPAPSQTSPPAQATSPPANSGATSVTAGSGDQAAARRALAAALACAPSNAQNLDPDGRAECGKRLKEAAAAMGDAKVDTIPPEKRAYYDAVQKAYQDIRHYPTPDTALTHLPGAEGMYDQRLAAIPGRPPTVGCGMKFGGPKSARPTAGPPHGLFFRLGPLICGVTPPQGVLTEESATPNADDAP